MDGFARTAFSSWHFWAVCSAVFAALTAVFGKIGVENVSSAFATLIRTIIIFVLMSAIAIGTKAAQPLASISAKAYVFLVLSGIATGLSWLCYYQALKMGSASAVAAIDKLSVVFVAIMGVILLGESLSAINWLGIVLVAIGAMLIGARTP